MLFFLFLQSRWQTHINDATTIRDVTIPAVTTAQVRYNTSRNYSSGTLQCQP